MNHKTNIVLRWKFLPPPWLSVFTRSQWLLEPQSPVFWRAKSSPGSTTTHSQALKGKAQARKARQTHRWKPTSAMYVYRPPYLAGLMILWQAHCRFYKHRLEAGKGRRGGLREEASKFNDKITVGFARTFHYISWAVRSFPTPLWPKECREHAAWTSQWNG